jgi:hypothetical protein
MLANLGRRHVVRDTRSSPELRRIFERQKNQQRKTSVPRSIEQKKTVAHIPPKYYWILTKRLLGKREASICEAMNTFDVNADCNIIGMFKV